ncbi:MAG: hypothetical protein D6800_00800 [Candidatus Zixiibacteriota bacterium]|nr:MAG: hypothetical protein D6800_00800 [candidate division Zixibacteria bacterium]
MLSSFPATRSGSRVPGNEDSIRRSDNTGRVRMSSVKMQRLQSLKDEFYFERFTYGDSIGYHDLASCLDLRRYFLSSQCDNGYRADDGQEK